MVHALVRSGRALCRSATRGRTVAGTAPAGICRAWSLCCNPAAEDCAQAACRRRCEAPEVRPRHGCQWQAEQDNLPRALRAPRNRGGINRWSAWDHEDADRLAVTRGSDGKRQGPGLSHGSMAT